MTKIPIRLYYTSDGELFTQGNLNNVPMLNRLSNYAYSLFLITPVKPYETLEESSEKVTIVNVYFEKGDRTQTEQYPMAWVNRVPVKVRNTEEEWNVYKCDISDDVLTISSFEHDNTLGIGFSISIPTGSTTNDGEQIYQTLNYSPYYTACNYTITGNARTYDDFTLDIITEYLNTMLKTKLNNIDGITKTSTLPTIYSDPNDVENYNVNKLFILTSIIEGYDIGDIIAITRTGSSSYGYIKIVNGADYIEAIKQRIIENEKDISNILDGTQIVGVARNYDEEVGTIQSKFAEIITELNTKINKNDGINKTDKQPTLIFDISNKNYNIHRLYIVDTPIGIDVTDYTGTHHYEEGTIFYGDSEGVWHKVVEGSQYVKNILDTIESLKLNKIDIDTNDTLVWDSEKVGKVFINVSEGFYKGLIYLVNEDSNVPFTYLSKTLSQLNDINSDLTTSLTRLGTAESEILKLKSEKMNKIFSDLQLRNNIGDNSYLPIYVGDTAYRISWSDLKKYIESGGSDHYKGDYVSYEQLIASVENPSDGDYAYVEVNENELTLYIWDTDDNIWRMSSVGQFLSESVFNKFQEELLNGTIIVNKTKNYDESEGNIKEKFTEVENEINENQIQINGDIPSEVEVKNLESIFYKEQNYKIPKVSFIFRSEHSGNAKNEVHEIEINGDIWKVSYTTEEIDNRIKNYLKQNYENGDEGSY